MSVILITAQSHLCISNADVVSNFSIAYQKNLLQKQN